MPDTSTPAPATSAGPAPAPGPAAAHAATAPRDDAALLQSDTIVEEISIDGMCGVY